MTPALKRNLDALAKSKFRAKFKLDEEDHSYLKERGMAVVQSHALDFVKKRLAPASPAKDGKQTPTSGHPVFKAQHATATCCRGCLEKWHKIKKGKPLSPTQVDFVIKLVLAWIEKQST